MTMVTSGTHESDSVTIASSSTNNNNNNTEDNETPPCAFLNLPGEIRNQIYRAVLISNSDDGIQGDIGYSNGNDEATVTTHEDRLALLRRRLRMWEKFPEIHSHVQKARKQKSKKRAREAKKMKISAYILATCSTIHREAAPILYGGNRFEFKCQEALAAFIEVIGFTNACFLRYMVYESVYPHFKFLKVRFRVGGVDELPSVPLSYYEPSYYWGDDYYLEEEQEQEDEQNGHRLSIVLVRGDAVPNEAPLNAGGWKNKWRVHCTTEPSERIVYIRRRSPVYDHPDLFYDHNTTAAETFTTIMMNGATAAEIEIMTAVVIAQIQREAREAIHIYSEPLDI